MSRAKTFLFGNERPPGPTGRHSAAGQADHGSPATEADTIAGEAGADLAKIADILDAAGDTLYTEMIAALARRGLTTIHHPCTHCQELTPCNITSYPEVKMACQDAVNVWSKAIMAGVAGRFPK